MRQYPRLIVFFVMAFSLSLSFILQMDSGVAQEDDTASNNTEPPVGIDSVTYSGEQDVTGWLAGESIKPTIFIQDGQGALQINTVLNNGYGIYEPGNENPVAVWTGGGVFPYAPGTYELRTNDILVGEVLVTAGSQSVITLDTGVVNVVNPGNAGYEIRRVDTDAFIANNVFNQFGLASGDYYILQDGHRVLDFTLTRGRIADIELDTGFLTVNNPGRVAYEVRNAATDQYVYNNALGDQFGVRSGDYYILYQGHRSPNYPVTMAQTTPVELPTGTAIVSNPSGVGYEVREDYSGRFIGNNALSNQFGLVEGDYFLLQNNVRVASFSVVAGGTTNVSLP